MKQRTVFFLSYLGGIGGGETFLLNHLSALDRSRFAPVVGIATPGPLRDRVAAVGIPTDHIAFANPRGPLGKAWHLGSLIPTLVRWIREHGAALVHINDVELGKFGALAARVARIPCVWTCHGWWYAGATRELFYRVAIDHTVAVSEAVRSSIVRRGILPSERTSVIHPGVDLATFAPLPRDHVLVREFGIPDGAITVAILGRFQAIKRHDLFLDAARAVALEIPDAFFLIVGGNVFGAKEDERVHQELTARVDADDLLRERVRLVGFRSDVPRVLSITDIVVSTSEAETFGMIHVEAAACGRPVVSTCVGGPSEIVAHGKTGYLVPPNDANAVADRILALCRDVGLRRTMGEAARTRAQALFDRGRQTARYEGLYEQLLERP